MKVIDPETGKKFTKLDLVAHGSTFMYQLHLPSPYLMMANISTAGSDTTAACLTFLLYNLLANNCKYWDRLAEEVRSRYDCIEDIFSSSSSVPFLDAVVNEGILYTLWIWIICESSSISASGSFQPPERSSSWWNVCRRSFHPRSGSIFASFSPLIVLDRCKHTNLGNSSRRSIFPQSGYIPSWTLAVRRYCQRRCHFW